MRSFSIQGPASTSVAEIAISLGMNDSVCSLIEVAAWKAPMTRPVTNPTINMGAASIKATSSARPPTDMMVSGFIGESAIEARGQGTHDERPAVDEHEQHQLEGQGDEHGREHHHAHGHQHARHHQVEDHERNEAEDADQKGGLQLARDDGGYEDHERHVLRRGIALAARDTHESGDVALARLVEHELLERRHRPVERHGG